MASPDNREPAGIQATRGVQPLTGRFETAVGLLKCAASFAPEREAFVDGTQTLCFGEWDRRADRLAGAMWEMGVRPGDVIALMLPSSIDYAICYHAAMRLRAITSGINLRLGTNEVRQIFDRLNPVITIHDEAVSLPTGCGRLIDRRVIAGTATRAPSVNLPVPRADDTVAIVWTGGTTGQPKGVTFDHRNLAAVAAGTSDISQPGDHRFGPVPFAHVNYMTRCWDEIRNFVTTVIAPQPWKARTALECMVSAQVTVAQMLPTQWKLLLESSECKTADLSRLRLAYTGGSSVSAELVREIKQRLNCPVVVRYTATEVGVGTGTRLDDPPEVVADTVGRPVYGVEMSIVGEDERDVQRGSVGRIRFRSQAVMRGYWRDPALTAKALSQDGWLMTGDTGWLDEHDNLHFTGRLGDMYIRGGYNVYPIEVEGVLMTHPAVRQAAIVGIPDRILGEIGAAFIITAVGQSVSLDQLRQWSFERLADYKAPDRFYQLESYPLTAVGKIDKIALLALAEEAQMHRK
jgi:acyl-CoA synthetase (AMP-forming)/AMP-acid ligase II